MAPAGRQRLTAVRRALGGAALSAVAGGVVGLAAFAVSQSGGRTQCAVVGVLAGLLGALGNSYRRSVQLVEVNLALPVADLKFRVNNDTRQAAERLFFIAATRIATRALEDDTGLAREALTSLKTMFDLYREPLESGNMPPAVPGGDSLSTLVIDIFNQGLAPFLSKWHRRLRLFEGDDDSRPRPNESDWPDNVQFREELRELQRTLRPYILGLGKLAALPDPERHLPSAPSATASPVPAPARGSR